MTLKKSGDLLCSRVAQGAATCGFVLSQPFRTSCYNRAIEPEYRLPQFDRDDALGVLVGNEKSLWPKFMAALRSDVHLRGAANPIECYCERELSAVFEAAAEACGSRYRVRWAHDGPPRRVAMQRLADVSGLAPMSESHLNIHPVYGPWIALRAVVVFDCPPPESVCSAASPHPCAPCTRQCREAFAKALAAQDTPSRNGATEHWKTWLAVRDACPVGREHRYSDLQIRYHYLKNPKILEEVL